MSDLLKCLLATIFASGVLVALAIWFLRRSLARHIAKSFAEREKILESKLSRVEQYQKRMSDISAQVLSEIHGVVYRSRNLAHEVIDSQDGRHVESLISYWNQLSDHLFKYELFVPDETFDLIHQYKRLLQDISLTLGASMQRTDEKEEHPSSYATTLIISREDLEVLHAQMPMLDELYREILSDLREIKDIGVRPSRDVARNPFPCG